MSFLPQTLKKTKNVLPKKAEKESNRAPLLKANWMQNEEKCSSELFKTLPLGKERKQA